MSKFNPRIQIPTAIDSRNTFDLSCDHVTTMSFLESKITYCKEVMPGESTEINVESFSRLSALAVPTFGRMNIVHRAFFVPFRTVFKNWNAFITNSFVQGQVVSNVPTITNRQLSNLLKENYSISAGEGEQPDYYYYTGTTNQAMRFTDSGRSAYDILVSLGYKLTFNNLDSTHVSFLPLLCYAKAMRDWIINENFNQFIVNRIDYYIDNINELVNGGKEQNLNQFFDILITNVVSYEQDYFTSACVYPNGPNGSINVDSLYIQNNNPNFSENDYANISVDYNNDAFVSSETDISIPTTFNQFALDALKHVSDYLKRHQLVGSKIIDRYLAHYGKKLNPAVLNRSIYLGKSIVPIQVGDVMSTADTDGAVLGDYAGRGLGYGSNSSFSIKDSDEFGYIIVISQVVPKIGYVEGVDRSVLHISPQDFFTPEFDSLGYQAIARKELYVSNNGQTNGVYDTEFDSIFGYSPRYGEYKVGRDKLSGNYLFPSSSAGEDSWYLFRKMYADDMQDYQEINEHFVNAFYDREQYGRIFNGWSSIAQPFRCIFHFDVKASLPATKLFDNYEWHEHGKVIDSTINGSANLAGTD